MRHRHSTLTPEEKRESSAKYPSPTGDLKKDLPAQVARQQVYVNQTARREARKAEVKRIFGE